MKKKDSSSWSEIKSLDERLAREPDSFCFARLSEVYLKVGLVADALHTARQGVAKHPSYLAGQRALAMACNANGLHDESRTILEHVTAAVPEDTAAQKLLAHLYVEAGDTASAIRAYTAVLDFRPEDVQSRKHLEELQDPETCKTVVSDAPVVAVTETSDAIGSEVPEEEVYELREEDIVYDDEEEEEPEDQIETAAPAAVDESASDHHDPLSTLTLAELYEQQGFIVKALDIYRTILADDPANAQLQAKVAELENQLAPVQEVPEQEELEQESAGLEVAELPGFQAVQESPEAPVHAMLEDVPAPLDSQAFAPLAHQTADNVVGTLDGWLENIRRIKACR